MSKPNEKTPTQRWHFTILGEPFGKLNMQPCRRGSHVTTFSPKKNTDYMERVIFNVLQSITEEQKNLGSDDKSSFRVVIFAWYPIPKNTSKVKTQKMLTDLIRPTKKPDVDNISKVILDGISKIQAYGLWKDDSQVVEEHIYKFYSEQPRVEVMIQNFTINGRFDL